MGQSRLVSSKLSRSTELVSSRGTAQRHRSAHRRDVGTGWVKCSAQFVVGTGPVGGLPRHRQRWAVKSRAQAEPPRPRISDIAQLDHDIDKRLTLVAHHIAGANEGRTFLNLWLKPRNGPMRPGCKDVSKRAWPWRVGMRMKPTNTGVNSSPSGIICQFAQNTRVPRMAPKYGSV